MKKPLESLGILVFYTVLSAVFTWPAVLFARPLFPTRQFDIYPVLWLIDEAPEAFPTLMHPTSAWPYGELLVRIDSYVLLYLSWINGNLLSSFTIASLLLWLGPVINAMAAEHCASAGMKIARPWSVLAGMFFGFSSIAASAVLEGHLYYLLNPWLPLLLKALWEGSEGRGGWKTGFLAGIWFVLSLFTSAYIGICAALLVAWMGLRAPRAIWKTLWGVLILGGIAGGYYIFLFRMGGVWEGTPFFDPAQNLKGGATTLLGLLSWADPADTTWHSIVSPLAFSMFWAIGFSIFARASRLRWLAIGAGIVLLLSFGASFQLWPKGPSFPGPLSWLAPYPWASFFRFPVRLLWLFNLWGSMVAAEFFCQLSQKISQTSLFQAGVFGIALVDTLGMTGMPARLESRWISVPSAYEVAPKDAAVLDLMGEVLGSARAEMAMRRRILGCFYQTQHQRPVLDVCIGTSGDSPREIVSSWLMPNLFLPKEPNQISYRLAKLGIGAVVLHLDTFRTVDALALSQGLQVVLSAPAAHSEDGGARIELYLVPNYERSQKVMIQTFRGFQGKVP